MYAKNGSFILAILFSGMLLVGQASVAAEPSACISTSGLTNQLKVLDLPNASGQTVCPSDRMAWSVVQSLQFLSELKLADRPVDSVLNQKILPSQDWLSFLIKGVQQIHSVKNPSGSACALTGTIAFAPRSSESDQSIVVCDEFAKLPLLDRAEALMHEARHNMGSYAHVLCSQSASGESNRDFNQNGFRCDTSIHKKGAYAVTVESYAKLGLLANVLTENQREYAKIYALLFASQSFNEPVQDLKSEAVYAVSESGDQAFFISQGKVYPARAIVNSSVISRKELLQVFPDDLSDSYGASVLGSGVAALDPIGRYSKRYNTLAREARAHVQDVVDFKGMTYIILERRVLSLYGDGKEGPAVTLPENILAVFTADEIKSHESDALFVLTETGAFYQLQVSPGGFLVKGMTNPIPQWLRMVKVGKSRFALSRLGEVFWFVDGHWQLFEPLQNLKVKTLTRPFSWSPEYWRAGVQLPGQ